jgi:hypothetical protein
LWLGFRGSLVGRSRKAPAEASYWLTRSSRKLVWIFSHNPAPGKVLAYLSCSALVQQPCSNPGKSPEMIGNASTQKYGDLQEICKLQNPPANYYTAFTRQRSLVRTQHRPSTNTSICRENVQSNRKPGLCLGSLGSEACSNAQKPLRL